MRGWKLRALRIAGGSDTVFERPRRRRALREEPHARALRRDGHHRPQLARRQRHRREGRDRRRGGFTFDNVVVPRRARHRLVGPQRVRVRDRRGRPDRPQQPLHATARRWTCSSRTGSGGPHYGNVTLENNVFEHSMRMTRTPGTTTRCTSATTGPDGAALTQLGRPQQHVRDRRARDVATRATGSRWVGNLGGWKCVPGVDLPVTTWARRCGAIGQRRSRPMPRPPRSTAPFGWVDPGRHDFRLKAGSPAIDAGDPDGRSRLPTVTGSCGSGRRTPERTSSAAAPEGPAGRGPPPPARRERPSCGCLRCGCAAHHLPARPRGCPSAAKLRVDLSDAAQLTVRVVRGPRRCERSAPGCRRAAP